MTLLEKEGTNDLTDLFFYDSLTFEDINEISELLQKYFVMLHHQFVFYQQNQFNYKFIWKPFQIKNFL